MNSYLRRAFVIAYAAVLNCAFTYDVLADTPLRVEASATDTVRSGAVAFTITNTSSAPIEINESALPWGNRYSVLLVAVLKRTQETLRAGYPIDDVFVEKTIRLAPGEQLKGEVALSEHFGELDASRRKSDLLVFWYFAPKGAGGKPLGEYGSWVLLPMKPK